MHPAQRSTGLPTELGREYIGHSTDDPSCVCSGRSFRRRAFTTRLGVFLVAMAIASAVTRPVFAAHHRTASLVRDFPATHMYPAHYQVMPIRTYTSPLYVFGETDGKLATRHHFEQASTRDAFGRSVTQVVTVTIARFRSATDADWFRVHMRTSVLPGKSASTRIIAGLGRGNGRYVSGICVSCGTGAPPLGQLVFNRGPILVLIGIQQADLRKATPLAHAIDRNLSRSLRNA